MSERARGFQAADGRTLIDHSAACSDDIPLLPETELSGRSSASACPAGLWAYVRPLCPEGDEGVLSLNARGAARAMRRLAELLESPRREWTIPTSQTVAPYVLRQELHRYGGFPSQDRMDEFGWPWPEVARACEAPERLSETQQWALLDCLYRFSMYPKLLQVRGRTARRSDRLDLVGASAQAMLLLGHKYVTDPSWVGSYNPKALHQLTRSGDASVAYGAALRLLVFYGKIYPSAAALEHVGRTASRLVSDLLLDTPAPDHLLRRAGFLRAWAFVPFSKRDRRETEVVLDECEALGRSYMDEAVVRDSHDRRFLAGENLCATLETRSKVSELCGDLDGAVQRLRESVSLDPRDPRRQLNLAQLLLKSGQAEAARSPAETAAALGPPVEATAWALLERIATATGDLPAARRASERRRVLLAPSAIRT